MDLEYPWFFINGDGMVLNTTPIFISLDWVAIIGVTLLAVLWRTFMPAYMRRLRELVSRVIA